MSSTMPSGPRHKMSFVRCQSPRFNASFRFYAEHPAAALAALNTLKGPVVMALYKLWHLRASGHVGSSAWIEQVEALEAAGSQPVATLPPSFTGDPTSQDCILVGGIYLVAVRDTLANFKKVLAASVSPMPPCARACTPRGRARSPPLMSSAARNP